MLKFLTWLLVPVFPLLGLLLGVWLIPERKSRWEANFKDNIAVKGLGFVDEGKILLLIETKLEASRINISNNAYGFIGLDARTGEQLFRTSIVDELLQGGVNHHNAVLSPDGKGIILNHRVQVNPPENSYDEVVVYDWKASQISKRYRSSYSNGSINWPMLRGTTMAAMGATSDGANLILWNDPDSKPAVLPVGKQIVDFGISDDGAIVHVCCVYGAPFELILIDTKKQQVIQKIAGLFRELRWAGDHQSFLAVMFDVTRKVHFSRRYHLVNEQFEAESQNEIVLGGKRNFSRNTSTLIMTTYTHFDPWRTKLESWLGGQLRFIVDRLWPAGQVVQIHDEQTGMLLQSFLMPNNDQGDPIVCPDHQSLVTCHWQTVSLWDFHSASRWYPIFGLFIGLLSSTLLAWKLLRHSPRASKVPATA